MSAFRTNLRNLSLRLSPDDIDTMKFICTGTLPASVVERIHDGISLFQALEERGKIGPNNLAMLEEILKAAGKENLVPLLTQNPIQQVSPIQSPTHALYTGKASSFDYRGMLNRVADSLTKPDVHQLVYLFPEINNEQYCDTYQRDRREVFIQMERHRLIMPGNLERLKWALTEIGRKDLAAVVSNESSVHVQSHPPYPWTSQDENPWQEGIVSRSVSEERQQGISAESSSPRQQQPPNGRWYEGYPPQPRSSSGSSSNNSNSLLTERANPPRVYLNPRSIVAEETQRWEQHYPGYQPPRSVISHPPLSGYQPTTEKYGSPPSETEKPKGPQVVVAPHPSYREEYMGQMRQMVSGHEQLREDRNRFPLNPPQVSSSYEMDCKPHGVAVIIVVDEIAHSTVYSGISPTARKSIAIDKASLEATFKYLDYSVEMYYNLSSSEMQRTLSHVAGKDHSQCDSFILCFLGSGTENGVLCSDGEVLLVREISAPFRDSQTLKGKPKMMFFQTSRGSSLDRGAFLPYQSTVPDSRGMLIPSEADFLFAHSTAPGYSSHSISRGGSFYITALTDVLTAQAASQDLLAMLTAVSDRMARTEAGLALGQPVMQIQEVVSYLRKAVWFMG